MGIFGASVAALLMFIYFATVKQMEDQLKNTVNIQLSEMQARFISYGAEEVKEAVRKLIAQDSEGTSFYLLLNNKWQIIAGNLEMWPGGTTGEVDWVLFNSGSRPGNVIPQANALGRTITLPESYLLFIGHDFENMARVQAIIIQVLHISLLVTVAMAVLGGLLLAFQINRRIEAVNAICRRVMSGELSERVKVTGSGDEFDHLAENFNAMLAKIGELLDGVKQVSYNIAHDLRTPLNRVRQRLEQLSARKMTDAKANEEVTAAIKEVDALVSTFNAIMRISQAESGAGIEHFEAFDLTEALTDVVDLYSALAEAKDITLETQIADAITLVGDRHLLIQAFANLVDNAIKYAPNKGTVSVALTAERDRVTVTVADNGPGIPQEYYERVTERFFRLEASRSTPGSGLGLSLAHAALKLHGGEMVFADNHPGLKVSVIVMKRHGKRRRGKK